MLEMKQMGVGLAIAVLIDATLVRVVMLPALLLLFGRAAWWPGSPTPSAPTTMPAPRDQPELVHQAHTA